jgi:hypothetical protein
VPVPLPLNPYAVRTYPPSLRAYELVVVEEPTGSVHPTGTEKIALSPQAAPFPPKSHSTVVAEEGTAKTKRKVAPSASVFALGTDLQTAFTQFFISSSPNLNFHSKSRIPVIPAAIGPGRAMVRMNIAYYRIKIL